MGVHDRITELKLARIRTTFRKTDFLGNTHTHTYTKALAMLKIECLRRKQSGQLVHLFSTLLIHGSILI